MTASKLCGPHAARPPGKRNQYSGNPVSCPSPPSLTALPSRRKKTNPGEGNKGKGKSCRRREKVKWLGHFLSPRLVSRWIRWKNTAVGNKVGCALKTRVRVYPPPSGSVCSVRLLAFLLAAFLGFGGFLFVFILFWSWSHRAENIVCTHHGTDVQINSTWLFLSALFLWAVFWAFFLTSGMRLFYFCTPLFYTVFLQQWQN